MSIEQMRAVLMTMYGTRWQAKVAKMPDKQVHTVYMRLLNKGLINN
jgi:hypothetical protein